MCTGSHNVLPVDIITHAIDFSPPSTIILISGDRDFSYAVSTMRLRNYRVVLLAPTAAHSSLRAQASVVYEWPRSVLQAEMPVPTPPPKSRIPAAYATRPSAPISIDRTTPSIVHIGQPSSSPQSALFRQNFPSLPGEDASPTSLHHRSSSLPDPEHAFPPNTQSKANYAAVIATNRPTQAVSARHQHIVTKFGSCAIQDSPFSSTQRLSPAWRSSKSLATMPVCRPQSMSTVSRPCLVDGITDAMNDQPSLPPVSLERPFDDRQGYNHGDVSGEITDVHLVPATPAGTEVSLDDEGGNPASFDVEEANDQHDQIGRAHV